MSDLLPSNQTPFENALDLTGARVSGLPVNITTIINPAVVQENLLPWLAWSMSADMWRQEWPIEKRRRVTAKSLVWHYKKGTASLLRTYAEIMGGRVTRLITPPAKTFLLRSLTEDERLVFLRRFPQLRVYPYVARGFNKFAHFTTAAYGRQKAFAGATCIKDVRARARYTRTAEMRDGTTITRLTFRRVTGESVGMQDVSVFEEIILPPKPTDKIFPNGALKARNYFGTIGYVGERLIRIKRDMNIPLTVPRETYTTISPGQGFIDVSPETIRETHPAQKGSLFPSRGCYLHGATLPPTISWQHIYECWYLFDPDRVPDQRKRNRHLGFTRLGMPAYHAEASVQMPGRAHPREAWRFVSGFMRQRNSDSIDRTLQAVRMSKAVRDKVLVNTKTRRPPRVGDRLRIGSAVIGQYVNA